jgi:hypothetical protein
MALTVFFQSLEPLSPAFDCRSGLLRVHSLHIAWQRQHPARSVDEESLLTEQSLAVKDDRASHPP